MADLEEDDLLTGVPDDVAIDSDDDDELLEEREPRPRSSGKTKDDPTDFAPAEDAMDDAPASADADGDGLSRRSGKRRIIQHGWSEEATMRGGLDVTSSEERAKMAERAAKFGTLPPADDPEEKARREARAAKFGLPPPSAAAPAPALTEAMEDEVVLLTAEEVEARTKRAAKFGVEPVDPLQMIEKAAPKDAFWEKRRDAGEDEVMRAEAVHIFGTDRLGTQDLLSFFAGGGLAVRKGASRVCMTPTRLRVCMVPSGIHRAIAGRSAPCSSAMLVAGAQICGVGERLLR